MFRTTCSEDECGFDVVARGLCRSHYNAAAYRGDLHEHVAPKLARSDSDRFLAFVPSRPSEGCWLWGGNSYPSGYGQFWLDGRGMTAHRAAYLLFVGPVERGQVVCHRCDVKACVRTDHLFVGSQAANIADKVRKDRQAKGSGHGNATHREQQVSIIRSLYAAGHTQVEIARHLGVSRQFVWGVVHDKAWKHVT